MSDPPLVSCIMPTANRRAFVPRAIEYFLRQDYPAKELLILDDGEDSVADLIPADPRIRYLRETCRHTVGAKRNALCEEARGDLVAHWDDDDWYPGTRISRQVQALDGNPNEADVSGSSRLYFLEVGGNRAWEYHYGGPRRPYVLGSTLVYRRELWRCNPFPDRRVGEDAAFVWNAAAKRVLDLADPGLAVAAVHPGNTSPKRPDRCYWKPIDAAILHRLIAAEAPGGGADTGRADGALAGELEPLPCIKLTLSSQQSVSRGPSGRGSIRASASSCIDGVSPMTRIRIGIPIRERADLTLATLDALAASDVEADLVLLADGADAATCAALPEERVTRVLAWQPARGPAACFNRLVESGEAEVYVLLENGARGGPHWLTRLLAALAAAPVHGLAGPSTNVGWNEQRAFPGVGGAAAEIARTAGLAAERFADSLGYLEPLYSLSDFCYAVKREVIDAIGAADEGYGLGPCWEMDYNIRAARAGFRGVWVRGAYVWRTAPGPRQRAEESAGFEAAKRRYQDRFCALRLRGERRDYEPHCAGDTCPHFAPADRIQIRIPLRIATTANRAPGPDAPLAVPLSVAPLPRADSGQIQPSSVSRPISAGDGIGTAADTHDNPMPRVTATSKDGPLVSCIMPTFDRRSFVGLSLQRFLEQDYLHKELIVVDDGTDAIEDLLAGMSDVHYLRLSGRHSIGYKRNLACTRSGGHVLVQWDDDDWYGPQRIARQVEPILAGRAQLTGIEGSLVMSMPAGEFWRLSPALHRRMFFGDVHGGTLAFARTVWAAGVRYPDSSLAEDAAFLKLALQQGNRLERIPNEELFAYTRHEHNAWDLQVGRHVDPSGWMRTSAPHRISPETIAAYRTGALQLANPSPTAPHACARV